ncbi:MAG: hypothetical protein ACP6KW_12490 [Candidatus Thorarchaeota archaeon]
MTVTRNMTEFRCRVCGELLRFDPADPSSFISKTEHDDFFGMQLTTYRIAHDSRSERHINSVVVDHAGLFRGYRDAYVEPVGAAETSTRGTYWVLHEETPAIATTENVTFALLISRTERWVVDIVTPERLNAAEMAALVLDRVEEAWRVYDTIPQPLEMTIADMKLHVWTSDSRVLCVGFTNHSLVRAVDAVARHIVDQTQDSIVPRRRMLHLIFQILETDPEMSPAILLRIMNEDMLYTTFHTPFEDRIPSIVERTAQRHPIAEEILGPLLRGYATLMDLLEGEYCSRYKEVIELVDFVNRRRILG